MSDEVREFHLDGKQLAFLVISAIGLFVVVFLCGVMVGRDVRGLPLNDSTEAASRALTAPTSGAGVSDADVPVATDGRSPKGQKEKYPIPNVDVTYPETLAAAAPGAVREPVPAPKATPAPSPAATRAPSPTTTRTNEPLFDVQVIALKQRGSAEKEKRRLEDRHSQYKSVVKEATVNGTRLFTVRVGPFSRPDAEAVVARLKKDFKNPPFVVPH